MKTYQRGSTVHVRLYDARVVQGKVKAILETTGGRKIRILSGECVLLVNADQISGVVRLEKGEKQ